MLFINEPKTKHRQKCIPVEGLQALIEATIYSSYHTLTVSSLSKTHECASPAETEESSAITALMTIITTAHGRNIARRREFGLIADLAITFLSSRSP